MGSAIRTRLKRNRIIALLVGVAVVFVCIILITQILSVRRKNQELAARKERLEAQIAEQEARQAELDDDEAYVKTKEYIEEKAKSIGYVYPDEIIFRKEE